MSINISDCERDIHIFEFDDEDGEKIEYKCKKCDKKSFVYKDVDDDEIKSMSFRKRNGKT